jgi:hypothetical protein
MIFNKNHGYLPPTFTLHDYQQCVTEFNLDVQGIWFISWI